MSTPIHNDSLAALQGSHCPLPSAPVPASQVTVTRIVSLQDFKKKFMESGCLKPAVLKNQLVHIIPDPNLPLAPQC